MSEGKPETPPGVTTPDILIPQKTAVTRLTRKTYNPKDAKLNKLSSQLEATRAELEITKKNAIHDAKTGLITEEAFSPILSLAIAEENRKKFVLGDNYTPTLRAAEFDLDRFGRFNQLYSHKAGNDALRAYTKAISASIREQDTAARIGGEEIMVLLPDSPPENGPQAPVEERIRQNIALSRVDHLPGEHLTASSGSAYYYPGENENDFKLRISRALTLAKVTGRNRTILAKHLDDKEVYYDNTNGLEYNAVFDTDNKLQFVTDVTQGITYDVELDENLKPKLRVRKEAVSG